MMRKVAQVQGVNGAATVYRDTEWDEYVVKLSGHPKADYFAADREDALRTAAVMAGPNPDAPLAERQAYVLNVYALKGNGFYGSGIGGRYFKARAHDGVLQVWHPDDWITVPADKARFHGPHGNNIIIPQE